MNDITLDNEDQVINAWVDVFEYGDDYAAIAEYLVEDYECSRELVKFLRTGSVTSADLLLDALRRSMERYIERQADLPPACMRTGE